MKKQFLSALFITMLSARVSVDGKVLPMVLYKTEIDLSDEGKKQRADIRINYEKYFYKSGVTPGISDRDKLVVEFMCRF